MTNNFKKYRNKESGSEFVIVSASYIKGEHYISLQNLDVLNGGNKNLNEVMTVLKRIKLSEFEKHYEPIENDNDK